jgi:predicted transcriptional regulator
MKHRSKLEIYIDVLNTIAEGNNKHSQIMQKTNLSYLTAKNCLKSLVTKGYVSASQSLQKNTKHKKMTINYFELTEKGKSVLTYFRNVNDIIEEGSNLLNPFSELVKKKRNNYK